MTAYYNEINPFAAAWLRNLISKGHIAPGEVDERSIIDVRPDDIRGFTQCHFFAGIGVWSYALRRAGWPDDRPVWTGSCPCQPFSAAGKGAGFDDERHLWPVLYNLIAQCRPDIALGEQVASNDGLVWLDLVFADLEAAGYASGAVDLCAAGVGAPHIRQRLWWFAHRLADAGGERPSQQCRGWLEQQVLAADSAIGGLGDPSSAGLPFLECSHMGGAWRWQEGRATEQPGRASRGMAHAGCAVDERLRGPGEASSPDSATEGEALQRERCGAADWTGSALGRVADARSEGRGQECPVIGGRREGSPAERVDERPSHGGLVGVRPGPVNGFWRDADWLFCRDGKWRPVEPRTFPLAHGTPRSMGALSARGRGLAEVAGLDGTSLARAKSYRVGTLRGYGNAINAEAAEAFIRAFDEALSMTTDN